VFKGEFKDEPTGEKYVQLNVLAGSDLTTIQNLCPGPDPDKSKWDTAISSLAVSVDTFYENPLIPGQFIVNPSLNVVRGAGDLVTITNNNTPVDSYALSAAARARIFHGKSWGTAARSRLRLTRFLCM